MADDDDMPEAARKEIADAIRIFREDHIHARFEELKNLITGKSSDPKPDDSGDPPQPPPPKDPPKDDPTKKKGIWWGHEHQSLPQIHPRRNHRNRTHDRPEFPESLGLEDLGNPRRHNPRCLPSTERHNPERPHAVMRTMLDSTTPDAIPATLARDVLVAGYSTGRYANLSLLASRFPLHTRVSIDTTGTSPSSDVRDWETGDKSGNLEQWVISHNAITGKKDAVVYCNRSTIAEVRQLTGSQILGKDYWLWVATLDGSWAQSYPGAPTGVIAVQQYGAAHLGYNADSSIVFADWWKGSGNAPPQPVTTWQAVVVQQNLKSYPVSSTDGGNTWHKI